MARKGRVNPNVRERAEQLAEQGMPYQMAMAVAHGRMDLNEALERMARRDRVNSLMERHGLSRALATQIAIGHADLDQVLARRRLTEHRRDNRERTCLVLGTKLALALHDGRVLKGEISAAEAYTFDLGDTDGNSQQVHKLEVKYAYDPGDWKKIKKGIRTDKDRVLEVTAPAQLPQDRYSCSDRRLFGYLDRTIDVVATLLSGEQLRGTVSWFSRYEFGMTLRTGCDVTIFRHALQDLGPA
ncbi:MAG: hypothetical protein KTR31_39645 [Myxococcales bacterium]|nr:hypothetical protein [Myxococcales bacterium]